MNTVKDLKQRLIDFLMSMDLKIMDIQALNTYSYIVKTMDEMEKPGYAESLALAFNSVSAMKKTTEEGNGNG